MEIIKNILHSNQYTTNLLIRKAKKGNNNTRIVKNSTYTKWLTVTYTGKQTKYITEEFENQSLKLLFRINSSTSNLLKYNNNNNDFYNMKEMVYINYYAQIVTKDTLVTIIFFFKKILKTTFNCLNMGITSPRFLNILSKNGHLMGPTDKIMGILRITRKGRHIEALRKLHEN